MFMRDDRISFSYDGVVTGFRWLFIVGISLWIASGPGMEMPALLLLLLEIGINISWIILLASNQSVKIFRPLSLVFDLLFAHGLFILFLPVSKGMGWVGLLPFITGIIYFRWLGFGVVLALNLLIDRKSVV
mgnify:CR=1 FL=1